MHIDNYLSITEWIDSFKPVYDPIKYAIAMKARDNNRKSKQMERLQIKDITKYNHLKSARAKSLGTMVSSFISLWGLDKSISPLTGYECAFIKFIYDTNWSIIAIEKVISNNSLQLKGRIDMVCKDLEGNIILIDFKTNQSMITFTGKMLGEFSTIRDSNLTLASIQLHTYNICSYNDSNIRSIVIQLHYDGDYKIIDVEPIRDLVINALKNRHNKLK